MDPNIPKFVVEELNKPWVNDELRQEIENRQRLYEEAQNLNTEASWDRFRQQKLKVLRVMKVAKMEFVIDKQMKPYEVYVKVKGFLSFQEVRNKFRECGTIIGIKKRGGAVRIKFKSSRALRRAIQLHNTSINGVSIGVNVMVPETVQPPGDEDLSSSPEPSTDLLENEAVVVPDLANPVADDAIEEVAENVPEPEQANPVPDDAIEDVVASFVEPEIIEFSQSEKIPENHVYVTPMRCVITMDDMKIWEKSEAYSEYLGFIMAMNEAIKGKSLKVDCPMSVVSTGIISLLDTLDVWIDETPPIEQPQRFGNKAFRTWFDKLKENSLDLLQEALPERFHRAIPEIKVYLVEGFGNSTQIDYGTGHELSFLMFLCCLFKIGAFVDSDQVAVATKVFNRYLILVRKLQLTYRMEPAGSHGVWSLDDYQFVPFIWGSSQLFAHPRIEPKSFVEADIVEAYDEDYMFIGCIQFIKKTKPGDFVEVSSPLWHLASDRDCWSSINDEVLAMYKTEVLGKFPVVQNILFGSLMTFKPAMPSDLASGLKRTPEEMEGSSATKVQRLNKD